MRIGVLIKLYNLKVNKMNTQAKLAIEAIFLFNLLIIRDISMQIKQPLSVDFLNETNYLCNRYKLFINYDSCMSVCRFYGFKLKLTADL
jgi:hypothetical protein